VVSEETQRTAHVVDAIRIEGLTKQFRSGWPGQAPATVLDGLSLSVRQGEIFGFLGPNGSGKTTTIKVLMGLIRATSGSATMLGKPVGDVLTRARIGFLPEAPYFYDYLTGEEFLEFYGALAGIGRQALRARVPELLETVGLADAGTRQLRKFSKGMLQRVGLAQALIHDPELVILDEPMSGLDPIGRKQVRDLILTLREQGKTVFFSTHIIPDVEMICDRVGVIVKGRLLAVGKVEDLMTQGHTQSVEVVCREFPAEHAPEMRAMAVRLVQTGRQMLIVLPGPERLQDVLDLIRKYGAVLVSVTPQKHSLEELFFRAGAPGVTPAERSPEP
jgi:ABC-2 type transport system ATP-binding protein